MLNRLLVATILAVVPAATKNAAVPAAPESATPVNTVTPAADRASLALDTPLIVVDPRHPDAVEAFHCTFESGPGRNWDVNNDLMPDGWTRRTGPKYPHYLRIELFAGEASEGKQSLRVGLNGGAASISSPPIEIGPEFSYVVECHVRTKQLVHDVAFMTITYFDAMQKQLSVQMSGKVTTTKDWEKLRIGPEAPPMDAAFAVIGLHVQPTNKTDIVGEVLFDDVWLGHMPRMTVVTSGRHNVFAEAEQFEVTCKISGILQQDPQITFELIDIARRGVDKSTITLEGSIVQRKSSTISRVQGLWRHDVKGYAGETKWSPTSMSPGFYRARVTMQGKTGLMQQREVTFAVIRPERPHPGGEFGWSLPRGEAPLSLSNLADLLGNAGISRVKFPVWHNASDLERGNNLVRFAERLADRNIRIVGLLNVPPSDVRDQFGEGKALYAANVFTSEPELWYRSLEPVMTRMSSKVSWWQLGDDSDSSFDGFPNASAVVRNVKKHLEQYGQAAHLGIGWRWVSDVPADPPGKANAAPWQFLALSADPPLTDAELVSYLDATRERGPQRWVVMEPLPRADYPMEVRASDLVQRMMAAKISGAEAVFVPDPFNNERGLMNDDGTPGELFLTWRTTALALAGATYLGEIPMPGGSHNRIFARGQDAVMVLWNEQPVEEELHFGKNVRQTDIWGRTMTPRMENGTNRVAVGPLPTFITGVNAPIMRLSMDFALSVTKFPNVYGKPHRSGIVVTNHFPQGMGGTITLVLPAHWRRKIKPFSIKLAAGETRTYAFDLTIPIDASSGPQELRVDFDIHADEHYTFSLHRQFEVGLGDVTVDVTASVGQDGVLTVKQEMTNNTDEVVDFKCYLSAPNERRQQAQVYRLGRGKDVKYYRYPNGRELVGKMLHLRAEEVDGLRTLNYRFEVRQ